jgi:arginine deiminase
VDTLKGNGYQVAFIPDEKEASVNKAFNFVTIGPREIVTSAGNPNTQAFYEELGITCHTVEADELAKAAGAMGCLSGILHREPV